MFFSIEALEARKGDCLLLHYGDPADPQLIVIDGGPGGVYKQRLKPRLEQLRQERDLERLPIRLLMVSHIDDDHINGVLDLTGELVRAQERDASLPYEIRTLWHNSFDDILGNEAEELHSRLTASTQAVLAASATGAVTGNLPLRHETALVLSSVNQGRQLRDDASALQLQINLPYEGLITLPEEGAPQVDLDGDGTLFFTVLGPREERVTALRDEWNRQIKKSGVARAAAFTDESVFNLSSLIILVEAAGKRALLTGDARGDDILAGLEQAGLLQNGTVHLDLLKLPHHGSDHNVSTEFFRQITADHYVVSGNGEHGNPEVATLQMLSDARGTDEYTIYLTNREDRLVEFFKRDQPGKNYRVVFREETALSVEVDWNNA